MKKLALLLGLLAVVLLSAPATFATHTCDVVNADGSVTTGALTGQHDPVTDAAIPCPITSATQLVEKLDRVFNIVFFIIVIMSSFMMIYAAFIYLTSEGEPEKVGNAKKVIIYAIVGLVVASIAYGLPRVIQGLVK